MQENTCNGACDAAGNGEFVSLWSPARFAIALVAISALCMFLELGRMDVWDDIEGQRATPPAEMWRNSDYVVATVNGETYLNKPPLLFWIIAGLYGLAGGPDEFLARVPTALSGVLIGLAVYAALRRRMGEQAARWTAVVTASSPYLILNARWTNLDVPLTLVVFLSLLALFAALESGTAGKRWGYALGAGLALGAATLLKGPPGYIFFAIAFLTACVLDAGAPERALRAGLIGTAVAFALGVALWPLGMIGLAPPFPAALLALFLVWIGVCIVFARPALLRGLPVFLVANGIGIAIAAPWALTVLHRVGWTDINALLSDQVVERTHSATAINSGSPFYYLYMLPGILAPWGLLLPFGLSAQRWRESGRFYRFSVLLGWLSVIAFCLIAGKENKYVLPAAPFVLLPVGMALAAFSRGDWARWEGRWGRIWMQVLRWLLPVGAVGIVVHVLISELHAALLVETMLIAAAVLALAAGPLWRGTPFPLSRIAAATFLVVLSVQLTRSFHYTGDRSPRALATLCGELIAQGRCVEATVVKPGMAFYAGRPIPVNQDFEAIRARFEQAEPYYYLTRQKLLDEFGVTLPEHVQPVAGPATSKDYLLLGNAPIK